MTSFFMPMSAKNAEPTKTNPTATEIKVTIILNFGQSSLGTS